VRRGTETFQVEVQPEMPIYPDDYPEDQRRPLIGVAWDLTGLWTVDRPGPVAQIKMSVSAMVNTFKALFSSSDVKAQHLSGPVGIMRIYYVLFESEQGWRQAIWFSVILNVNLALLNLLPIPVLDGGTYPAGVDRVGAATAGGDAHAADRAERVRDPDHWLHALRDVFRHPGSAMEKVIGARDQVPTTHSVEGSGGP
jgi:hypothetical protein